MRFKLFLLLCDDLLLVGLIYWSVSLISAQMWKIRGLTLALIPTEPYVRHRRQGYLQQVALKFVVFCFKGENEERVDCVRQVRPGRI